MHSKPADGTDTKQHKNSPGNQRRQGVFLAADIVYLCNDIKKYIQAHNNQQCNQGAGGHCCGNMTVKNFHRRALNRQRMRWLFNSTIISSMGRTGTHLGNSYSAAQVKYSYA